MRTASPGGLGLERVFSGALEAEADCEADTFGR